jgi:hypothetical protein
VEVREFANHVSAMAEQNTKRQCYRIILKINKNYNILRSGGKHGDFVNHVCAEAEQCTIYSFTKLF